MPNLFAEQKNLNCSATFENPRALPSASTTVEALSNNEISEVLKFLARRPLHTVMMTGIICDNGIESEFNRGAFYACRNRRREIEAVALIGHLTMLEAQTQRAKKALAMKAKEFKKGHVIFGEQERLEQFWRFYSNGGQPARASFRELLFSLDSKALQPVNDCPPVRRAQSADLELIVPVHAALAEAESGVNPLETDAEGFRRRCARRIEMGRTWIIVENNELAFKADVMVDTDQVNYLEGVYVAPAKRGRGFGTSCLSNLCRRLLASTASVCLMANELNAPARSFYKKVGFDYKCFYRNIFLQNGES